MPVALATAACILDAPLALLLNEEIGVPCCIEGVAVLVEPEGTSLVDITAVLLVENLVATSLGILLNNPLLTLGVDNVALSLEHREVAHTVGTSLCKVTLTPVIFNDDALILSDFKSKNIKIKSNNHNRVISFDFDSPFLGIWAKPNAPYVCLEPWWGVNDDYDKKADFSQKRGIMALAPSESKEFTWEVSISE